MAKHKLKKTTFRRWASLFLTGVLLAGLLPVGLGTGAGSRAAEQPALRNPRILKSTQEVTPGSGEKRELKNPTTENGITTWDCIWFGNYWQVDTNGDGKADKNDAKTPIKWRVLSVEGDDVFLLADKNLDCQKYNDTQTDVTWETCTMRSWLNGYGEEMNKDGKDYRDNNFLNHAFSADEQSAIRTTKVVNNDNSEYGTEGGNDTSDKVYLLSIDEVVKAEYGFSSDYSKYDEARRAKNTEYAKTQGAYTNTNEKYVGNGIWWLRSPDASAVGSLGCVYRPGGSVTYCDRAVRPALHLNLSSASSWSYAGTVTSDGRELHYGVPTSSDCRMIPAFSTYKKKLDFFYLSHSFFQRGLQADQALRGTSFAIPGLSTTNTVVDDGAHYVNNGTYVPQGICRMDDYILISAYQESYKGWKMTDDGKWKQDWRADYNSVIYVLDGDSFQYLATLVLPNQYHNGGIAFDGYNIWLTNTNGTKKVYYIKKDVIKNKTAEMGKNGNGPYSAYIRESEIGGTYSIKNKPSCLTWYDGKLWAGTNGEIGKICGYTVTGRDTGKPVLTSYKCETISSSAIPGVKPASAKCINGIAFDGGDLYLSVSSGRQGAVKHIIRAKKTGNGYAAGSYRAAKEVLVPDMSEELMIEGNTLYCVFESGANHYNGSYGKGPDIVTERVLAFDKKLWED